MKIALVDAPSPLLANCELTFLDRRKIDIDRARAQHAEYARALASLGVRVEHLGVNSDSPDSVFVEDTAVILDDFAVITSMGAESRRREVAAMKKEISRHRETVDLLAPAQLEGGDVLRIGKTLFVGESPRTNSEGIAALREITGPHGFNVVPVRVPGCLHLKTCVTALDAETLVMNPDWLDMSPFKGFEVIAVAQEEPFAANTLPVNGRVLLNAAFPRTADKIEARGYDSVRVDISEFGKAEAGLTCMSLIFDERSRGSELDA